MQNFISRFPACAALVACALAATLLSSCSSKVTAVDSSYTMPEGVTSPYAQMVVWNDQPTVMRFYHDNQPADPDVTDSLLFVSPLAAYPAGTHRGMIIDSTQADRYQIFRTEGNGGVRQLFNFALMPTRKWLQTLTEAYSFADQSPIGLSSYIGRGLVSGVATPTSPLTNFPTVSTGALANINLDAVWYGNGKIKLKWDQVPNAARYIVQVYTFRADIGSLENQVLSGVPAPLYDGEVSDDFVGFVPANVNLYFVGDSTRSDIKVIQVRPMIAGSSKFVRMAALDGQGHMIGITLGDPDPLKAFAHGDMGLVRNALGIGTYMLYPLGATTARDTVIVGPGGDGAPS